MTKKELKQELKQYGIYTFIHELIENYNCYVHEDIERQKEIIFQVLDNINESELSKAIKKASK